MTPADIERRIKAKRLNERLKLVASSFNTIGLTILGAAVLVPLTGGALSPSGSIWILVAVSLHFLGHTVLARLASED